MCKAFDKTSVGSKRLFDKYALPITGDKEREGRYTGGLRKHETAVSINKGAKDIRKTCVESK